MSKNFWSDCRPMSIPLSFNTNDVNRLYFCERGGFVSTILEDAIVTGVTAHYSKTNNKDKAILTTDFIYVVENNNFALRVLKDGYYHISVSTLEVDKRRKVVKHTFPTGSEGIKTLDDLFKYELPKEQIEPNHGPKAKTKRMRATGFLRRFSRNANME